MSAAGAGASSAQEPSPREAYHHALTELARAPAFRMIEKVDASLGGRRTAQAEVRFRAPDRLRTSVTTKLPPPVVQFTVVQVGGKRCQTPPGVCFRTTQRPSPTDAVRTFLGPALPVTYRRSRDAAGNVVLRLSGRSARNLRYFARLTVDRRSGLPIAFVSLLVRDHTTVARQTATFSYGVIHEIRLPKNVRTP